MYLSDHSIELLDNNVQPFKDYVGQEEVISRLASRKTRIATISNLLESDQTIDGLNEEQLDDLKRTAALVVNWTAPEKAKKDFTVYNPNLTIATFKELLKKLLNDQNGTDNISYRFDHFRGRVKTFGPDPLSD